MENNVRMLPGTGPNKETIKGWMDPLIKELEKYDIPDEKLEAVIDFAVNLFARHHRTMKIPRMARKVVAEFKLKLLKTEQSCPTL